MRIVAGKFKNRILAAPKGLDTRPTSGKLREAFFNMVQQSIGDSYFLDLFAGSGAIGFEALSRGASRVVFVDSSKQAWLSIEKNIASLDVKSLASIIRGDVFLAIGKLEKRGDAFDIIYADPPYAAPHEEIGFGVKVLAALDKGKLLKEGGHLFIEEGMHVNLEEVPLSVLKFVKKRDFGRSSLFHFTKEAG